VLAFLQVQEDTAHTEDNYANLSYKSLL